MPVPPSPHDGAAGAAPVRIERPVVFGLIAVVVLYLALVTLVHYHADDGYIALRYVQNLLAGHGLVYNPGERVEGYNCFLWLVLLGASAKALPFVPLHLVAEGAGILFGVATILLTAFVGARYLGLRGWWVAVAPALLAAHSGFVAWSTGGLETTFFAGLVLLTAALYLRWIETGRGGLAAPAVMAIASITRPDAVPMFLALLLHLGLVTLQRHGLRAAFLLVVHWVAVYAALVLPYYAWRYNYYGWPLPNTAYAKVGTGLTQYVRGLRYITDYAGEYGMALILLPAALMFLVRRNTAQVVFALLIAAHLGFVVLVGGDGLAFDRFLVYHGPLLLLLAAVGYRQVHELLLPRLGTGATVGAVALVLVSVVSVARKAVEPALLPARQSWTEPQSGVTFPIVDGDRRYTWFDNYFIDRQAAATRYLAARAPGALVAANPAGAVAYFGDLRVIDMLGLNDEHIAHVPVENMGAGRAGHEKGDGRYVLSRHPDAILLGNVAVLPMRLDSAGMSGKLVHRSEREIWADPSFHTDYELVSVPLDSAGPFQWFTYARRRGGAFASLTANDRQAEKRE